MTIVHVKATGVIAISATTSLQLFSGPNVTIPYKAVVNASGTLAGEAQPSYKVFWAAKVVASVKALVNKEVAAVNLALWQEAVATTTSVVALVFPNHQS